jgi:predicted DNA-binding protein (MmcQ/YjbR family)
VWITKKKIMMDIDWLRKICLGFPGVTEQLQWGNHLLFKVAGKMFAIASLEPAPVCLTFKCCDESFAELTERPRIIPAPYLARAKWAALEAADALTRGELQELLHTSYQLVFAKLPKRVQEQVKSQVSYPKRKRNSATGMRTRKSAHRKSKSKN